MAGQELKVQANQFWGRFSIELTKSLVFFFLLMFYLFASFITSEGISGAIHRSTVHLFIIKCVIILRLSWLSIIRSLKIPFQWLCFHYLFIEFIKHNTRNAHCLCCDLWAVFRNYIPLITDCIYNNRMVNKRGNAK